MNKQVTFRHATLPYLLVLPQLIVTFVFFLYPAGQALYQSLLREDAWGTRRDFVWFDNFAAIFDDSQYLHSLGTTFVFAVSVTVLSMGLALLLAVMADRVVRGGAAIRAFLIWPYAVAPAVAGAIWVFLFHPVYGIVASGLNGAGLDWNYRVNGNQALLLVVMAAAWKQISYNFLFFLAGLQAIPKSLLEAASIDCAGPMKRFWTIIFPLLSPTTFFLLVVNIVYAFFDTFGIIHAVTSGGPGSPGATNTLVYKVWYDAFQANDLGSSAAQSVVLMVIVIALTTIQFRYIERRVHY
ncbi:MAG: sn-glycerol-3-phosphate ABC transporter permease UgpA [Alphaproteobacteria bacterium]